MKSSRFSIELPIKVFVRFMKGVCSFTLSVYVQHRVITHIQFGVYNSHKNGLSIEQSILFLINSKIISKDVFGSTRLDDYFLYNRIFPPPLTAIKKRTNMPK